MLAKIMAAAPLALLCFGSPLAEEPPADMERRQESRSETPTATTDCSVTGIVRDSSGAVISGAIVIGEPGSTSTTTDALGRFCLPPGDATPDRALAVATGFQEQTCAIPDGATTPAICDFVLHPLGASDRVTVTATRTEKRLDDVPIRTEVVTLDFIKRSASRTLAEIVEFTPGLRVDNNCQNCNFTSLRLLGLEGPYTQILFDGQPTMSSLAQVYGIEQIPARMIDRVEVVKGGGSAIYGPGSVGGVVNIISRRPSHTGGYIEGRVEWLDGQPNHTVGLATDWVSKDRNTFITLFGQTDKVQPLDLTGDGFTEVGRKHFSALGLRFGQMLLGQTATLTFDANHIRENRRGGDRVDLPEHQAQTAESARTRRDAAGVVWQHMPSSGFDYRLGISFAGTRRATYYGSGMDPLAYGDSRNPLWVADSQCNHYLSDHILSWGAQLRSDSLRDSQPAYGRSVRETHSDLGFFLQDDWFFLPHWEIIYGVRVDAHSEIDRPVVSPRLALMWNGLPSLTVRGSIARGFLAPQVFDEDLHITQVGGEGMVIRNDSDLVEESSATVTLGAEWKPNWRNGTVLVECNLFHTGMTRLFSVVEADDPTTQDLEFTRTNLGDARVFGLEINLGYALADTFQLQFGVVEQRSRLGEPDPDFGSRGFFKAPNRYGVLTLLWKDPRWFDLFVGLRLSGAMTVPHYAGYIAQNVLEKTPAYTTIDLSLSRRLPLAWEHAPAATIGVRNLTNRYQNDLDQGPLRDSGYVWGPRFPRAFYVNLGWDF